MLEENGFPIAPAILGVVLGGMLEENFVTSMIKADGNLLAFFSRPIAGDARRADAADLVPAAGAQLARRAPGKTRRRDALRRPRCAIGARLARSEAGAATDRAGRLRRLEAARLSDENRKPAAIAP